MVKLRLNNKSKVLLITKLLFKIRFKMLVQKSKYNIPNKKILESFNKIFYHN